MFDFTFKTAKAEILPFKLYRIPYLNISKLQTIFTLICSYLRQKMIFLEGVSSFVTVSGSSGVKIFFESVGKHLTVILIHKFGQFQLIDVSYFENIHRMK